MEALFLRGRLIGLLAVAAWLAGCASTPVGNLPAPQPAASVRTIPEKSPPPPAMVSKPAPPSLAVPATGNAPAAASPAISGSPAVPAPRAAVPAPRVADAVAPQATAAAVGQRDLWERIRKGFAFPEMDSPLVAEKERFYLQKPEYLQRMFSRGNRYLYYIVEEVERRGLPTELALLPFVESAMNPVALSSAQAAGLWQFIPSTGKTYNLSQNWWVDNRRDVVHSTQAALDYLQKIYAMQGDDWFLALASYNWGENAVSKAVSRNKARGRPADYLSLDMPAETRNYVPKLIALKNIVRNAQELGIALPELPNKPYFVVIEKTRPIDLKLAAQFAGMSVDEFVALNPAHNRPVIAASKNNEIKLPADRYEAFVEAVERHGEARKTFASWQPHTLAPGETLEAVAERGGVTTAELRKANSLRPGARILAGTRIIAPQRRTVEDEMRVEAFVAPRIYEQVDQPAVYHTVGAKESLFGIADRYGISAASLKAWNHIKAGVRRGMTLLVKPASTHTMLTNESGDRQIVASSQPVEAQPMKVAASSDSAGSVKPAIQPAVQPIAAAPAQPAPVAAHAKAPSAAQPAAHGKHPGKRVPAATAHAAHPKAPALTSANQRAARPAAAPAAAKPPAQAAVNRPTVSRTSGATGSRKIERTAETRRSPRT